MRVGTYIYSKSIIHKMDARAKIIFCILFSAAAVVIKDVWTLFYMFLLSLMLSLIAVGIKETVRNYKRLLPLLLCIVLFMPLQERGGEALFMVYSFKLVTVEGFLRALSVALKFISISIAFSLLLETERQEILISALRSFGLPYGAALTLSMSLSFIPMLIARFDEIRASMSLRINDENREGFLAVLVAVVVSAVKQIPETAASLEERGYSNNGVRTSYRHLGWSFSVFTQILIAAIIPAIFFILEVFL